MKVGWVVPLVLTLSGHIIGLVSAAGTGGGIRGLSSSSTPIMDTAGFISAVRNAPRGGRNSPTEIQVHVNATIDFDDGTVTDIDAEGITIDQKHINFVCVGYNDANKCTLKRSASNGRFFHSPTIEQWTHEWLERTAGVGIAFTGFKFVGGSSQDGGAFSFEGCATNGYYFCSGTFKDCDFVDNNASNKGGTFFIYVENFSLWGGGDHGASLSFSGCNFDGNSAVKGSGIYAKPWLGGKLELNIDRTAFRNINGSAGTDIYNEQNPTMGGRTVLTCTETTSSGTNNDIHGLGAQKCSATAVPSSAPSNLPSSTPSASAQPSALPSARPSLAPSVSAQPSVQPSAWPSQEPTRGWQEITYDDFENNWGHFTKKSGSGENAMKVEKENNSGQKDFIPKGKAALRIRDDKGEDSSVYHKATHDVTMYSNLRVKFWYYPREMEAGELFVLEYSSDGGTSWKVMKRFVSGNHFENGSIYKETVDFDSRDKEYELTSQAKIRFRCKASGSDDYVYIDEVSFEGFP